MNTSHSFDPLAHGDTMLGSFSKAPTSSDTSSSSAPMKPKKKMSWKMILGAFLIAAVVVGGGAGFYLSQQSTDNRDKAAMQTTKPCWFLPSCSSSPVPTNQTCSYPSQSSCLTAKNAKSSGSSSLGGSTAAGASTTLGGISGSTNPGQTGATTGSRTISCYTTTNGCTTTSTQTLVNGSCPTGWYASKSTCTSNLVISCYTTTNGCNTSVQQSGSSTCSTGTYSSQSVCKSNCVGASCSSPTGGTCSFGGATQANGQCLPGKAFKCVNGQAQADNNCPTNGASGIVGSCSFDGAIQSNGQCLPGKAYRCVNGQAQGDTTCPTTGAGAPGTCSYGGKLYDNGQCLDNKAFKCVNGQAVSDKTCSSGTGGSGTSSVSGSGAGGTGGTGGTGTGGTGTAVSCHDGATPNPGDNTCSIEGEPTATNMSYKCNVKTAAGSYTIAHRWERCNTAGTAPCSGSDPDYIASGDLNGADWTLACGQEKTSTGTYDNFACGRVQVDVQIMKADGSKLSEPAGKVYNYGSDCSTTATPPASPSTPPGPQCLSITMSKQSPVIGDQVTFTCGDVSGADHYKFRVVGPGTAVTGLTATGRISAPFAITTAGSYKAQCQICTGANDTTCNAFETLN